MFFVSNNYMYYKNEKKLQKWMDKQEAKEANKQAKKAEKEEEKQETKSSNDHEYIKKEGEGEDAMYTYKEDRKNTAEETKLEGFRLFNAGRKDNEPYQSDKTMRTPTGQSIRNPYLSRGPEAVKATFNAKVTKDFEDKNIWNSVAEASKNSQPISDDLTPAEQEFLDSFKKR